MHLKPENFRPDEINRLSILEVTEGPRVKISAKAGSIITAGARHVDLSVECDDDYLEAVTDFASKTVKLVVEHNEHINSIEVEAVLMTPEKYLVVSNALVMDTMTVTAKNPDGKEETLKLSYPSIADKATELGFLSPNLMPIPIQLALALKTKDRSAVKSLKKRLKVWPSLYGKKTHKPKYKLVLNHFVHEGDEGRTWVI